jgi:phage-related protein
MRHLVVVNFAPCRKEIGGLPQEVKEDLADALARLEAGVTLSMPLSRPMPSIGPRVHELRFRDRSGIYRVIYFFATASGIIHLLCAFKKTTQKTEQRHIELAKKRLREVL